MFHCCSLACHPVTTGSHRTWLFACSQDCLSSALLGRGQSWLQANSQPDSAYLEATELLDGLTRQQLQMEKKVKMLCNRKKEALLHSQKALPQVALETALKV